LRHATKEPGIRPVLDIGPFLRNSGRIFEIVPADRGMIAAHRGTAPTNGEIIRQLFDGLAGILGVCCCFLLGHIPGIPAWFRHVPAFCEEIWRRLGALHRIFLKTEAGSGKLFRHGSGI
jgi:hypothetical protein